MGFAEVAFRGWRSVQAHTERWGLGLADPMPPAGNTGSAWIAQFPSSIDAASYRDAADRIISGYFELFSLRDRRLGFPPIWNRDPKSGIDAPLAFGKLIDYRDESVVGEIKYLWEINRHSSLVTLAQTWRLTGEERYLRASCALVESWWDQCPYPLGPNWSSALEQAVRLVNWAVSWYLLGENNLEKSFKARWLDCIYRHCHFIAGHLSRFSSANNHLLGELMAMFIGSLVWPLWSECEKWLDQAKSEFEAEALRQTGTDGVNLEQAVWYQHEVADMMLLVGLFGKANGVEFSVDYWQRLERMLEFFAAVMDVHGHTPMFGDSDDARLVAWSPSSKSTVYHSLLATGAVLFDRPDFARFAGAFDDKSQWLLGESGAAKFESLTAEGGADANASLHSFEPRRVFSTGGYYVLGCDFGTDQELRIVADAGPLGYLSIAAHGHADALSFVMSAGGREILVDPGTYTYRPNDEWRDYFRGTSAHNTVRVDSLDQSVIGGAFLWSRHARAWCEEWISSDEEDYFVGAHDGYQRLADPVKHRREIRIDKHARRLLVTDTLWCHDVHYVEVFWHFAECWQVVAADCGATVHWGGASLNIQMTGMRGSIDVFSGSESPRLGWISRQFGEKHPTPTLRWAGTISGSSSLSTSFQLSGLLATTAQEERPMYLPGKEFSEK